LNRKNREKISQLRTRKNHLELELNDLKYQLRNNTNKEDWAKRFAETQEKNNEIGRVISQLRELGT